MGPKTPIHAQPAPAQRGMNYRFRIKGLFAARSRQRWGLITKAAPRGGPSNCQKVGKVES